MAREDLAGPAVARQEDVGVLAVPHREVRRGGVAADRQDVAADAFGELPLRRWRDDGPGDDRDPATPCRDRSALHGDDRDPPPAPRDEVALHQRHGRVAGAEEPQEGPRGAAVGRHGRDPQEPGRRTRGVHQRGGFAHPRSGPDPSGLQAPLPQARPALSVVDGVHDRAGSRHGRCRRRVRAVASHEPGGRCHDDESGDDEREHAPTTVVMFVWRTRDRRGSDDIVGRRCDPGRDGRRPSRNACLGRPEQGGATVGTGGRARGSGPVAAQAFLGQVASRAHGIARGGANGLAPLAASAPSRISATRSPPGSTGSGTRSSSGRSTKRTLGHARMRHGEGRLVDPAIVEQQHVDVDRARSPANVAHPSQRRFDPVARREQVQRSQVGLDPDHDVEEVRLVGPAHRVGLPHAGAGIDPEAGFGGEEADRLLQGGEAIAQVRAEPEVGDLAHGFTPPRSPPRRPRRSPAASPRWACAPRRSRA